MLYSPMYDPSSHPYHRVGGIRRMLRDRFGDEINIMDMGAKGDGATDDSEALVRVRDLLERQNGGTVVFPWTPDGYLFDREAVEITVPSAFIGENRVNLIHRAVNDANQPYLFQADGINTFLVGGFTVTGNGTDFQRAVNMQGSINNAYIFDLVTNNVGDATVLYGDVDLDTSTFDNINVWNIYVYGTQLNAGQPALQFFPRKQSNTLSFDANSDVDLGTDRITITGHGLVRGQKVRYSDGGGTEIGGLTKSTTSYYVIRVDANTIELATTRVNAEAGTAVDLTTKPSSETHFLNPEADTATPSATNLFLDQIYADIANSDNDEANHGDAGVKISNTDHVYLGRTRVIGGDTGGVILTNGVRNVDAPSIDCSKNDTGLIITGTHTVSTTRTQGIKVGSHRYRKDGGTLSVGYGLWIQDHPDEVHVGFVDTDGDIYYSIVGDTERVLGRCSMGKVLTNGASVVGANPGSSKPPIYGFSIDDLDLKGGPNTAKGRLALGGANQSWHDVNIGRGRFIMPDGAAFSIRGDDFHTGPLLIRDGNPDNDATYSAIADTGNTGHIENIIVVGTIETFDANDDVDLTNDTIDKEGHGFVTGQAVTYSSGGGTDLGGLSDGTVYFVIVLHSGQIQLATTYANAIAGTNIDITTQPSSENHTLDGNQVDFFFSKTFNSGLRVGELSGSVGNAQSMVVTSQESNPAIQGTVTIQTEVFDLSGAAVSTKAIWAADQAYRVLGITFTYTEASSADAGVATTIARDRAGSATTFVAYTSEGSKAIGFQSIHQNTSGTRSFTTRDLAAGDLITVASAGGKTGTGELMATITLARLQV